NGDEDGVPHSLFIGFAPYDNPKVSISVVVEGGGEGRGIASEISSNVMKKAIELIE
ncbi:Penicillin-binding protein, putative, partial [Candidatus Arthromitus sp. SFB-1]